MQISKRIKQLRKRKGWTQERLAEKSNMSVQAIRNYEQGLRIPRLTQLEKLCEALEATMSDLFSNPIIEVGEDIEISIKTERGEVFVMEGRIKRRYNDA